MRRTPVAVGLIASLLAFACGNHSTTQPSSTDAQLVSAGVSDGGTTRAASPPNLVLRTVPPLDSSTHPYPTVTGIVPLSVRFNLCNSDDPGMIFLPDGTLDPQGDSLNWQFHFGDSGLPAFRPDGTFAPDFDHFCRVEHVYTAPGYYTATLRVTDKRLTDQGRTVAALACTNTKLTIEVLPSPAPSPAPTPVATPAPAPVITSFTDSWGCFPEGWTLTWTTTGATSASIDNGVGAVAVNGSRLLPKLLFAAGDYELTATGAGGTVTRTITLVDGGC
jgi:hypothetical protein